MNQGLQVGMMISLMSTDFQRLMKLPNVGQSITPEIKYLSKEQLLNRKKYVEIAINFWSENKEQAPKDRVDYNLDYFKTEMDLINKRL